MKGKVLSVFLSIVMSATMFLVPGTGTVARAVDDKTVVGGSIGLNTPTILTITKNQPYDTYLAYSFKTTNTKGYYYFLVNSTQPERSPSIYLSSEADFAHKLKEKSTVTFFALGDYNGGENTLAPNSTYHILIQRMVDIDYVANATLAFFEDREPDSGAQTLTYTAGSAVNGSIEGAADKDVWKFTTGDDDYTFYAKAEDDSVDVYFYSDASFFQSVDNFIITRDGRTIDLTTAKLEKNKTYYVVFKHAGNHVAGHRENYSFTITGKNGTDKQKDSNKNTKKTTKNYLKTISKSKYFVTNMTSKVSAKITGNKLVLTKAKGAYLFKKSKMKNNIFHKSSNLKKSKYTYKLAKNCKIVYGKKENGSKDTVKTKAWFNKAFKKKGSMYGRYNIGVCLNKKGQVTMIYVSGFDVGAEQTP